MKLEDFKTINESYQYVDFEWNSTIGEVRKKIDLGNTDDRAIDAKDEPVRVVDFIFVEQFELDGHGEPSEKLESLNEVYTSTSYIWDTDYTRLRFASIK